MRRRGITIVSYGQYAQYGTTAIHRSLIATVRSPDAGFALGVVDQHRRAMAGQVGLLGLDLQTTSSGRNAEDQI